MGRSSPRSSSASVVARWSLPNMGGRAASGGCTVHASTGRSGWRRAAAWVYTQSAPTSTATSSWPRPMARDVALTKLCGLLPPVVASSISAGSIPSAEATGNPGLR